MPSKKPDRENVDELLAHITELRSRVNELEHLNHSLVVNSKQQRLLLDMVTKMLSQAIEQRDAWSRKAHFTDDKE